MQTPLLSKVAIIPGQAIAHVLQSGLLHPGHYYCQPSTVKNAVIKSDAAVYFNNIKVGTLTGKQFHSDTKSLFLYFDHNFKDLDIAKYLWCSPMLDIEMLQCPSCNTYYERGDNPCECIYVCDYINILRLFIRGVIFHDARNDDEDTADFRPDILKEFFSGMIGSLEFRESF